MSVTKYMVFTPGSTAPPGGPWTSAELRTRRAAGEIALAATVSVVGESAWRGVGQVLAELDAEPRWLVRSPGSDQVVGPVSVDLIRRGLAAGKIPSDSLTAEEGSTEWLPVMQVVGALADPDVGSAASHPTTPVAPAPETTASRAVSTSLGVARKGSIPRRAYLLAGVAALGLAGAAVFGLLPRGAAGTTSAGVPAIASPPSDPQTAAQLGFKLYDVDPKDQAGAVRLWEPACTAGNTLACAGMGIAYTFGTGGKTKDEKKGFTFIEPACTKGEQRACQVLARFYYFAWGGVPKDIEKGRDLWKKACDSGESRGCYFLGLVYTSKDGPPAWRDVAEGKRLLELSCRLDYKDGCDEAKKLDTAARVEKLREKVTRKYADRDKDNECLGKGYPPYRWEYGGGTFAEDREVAESDGCKKLHYVEELQVYCCPKVPSSF